MGERCFERQWRSQYLVVAILLTSSFPKDALGRDSGAPAKLASYSLPKFLPTSNKFSFTTGQAAKLTCAVSNLGKRQQVVWRQASKASPLTVGQLSFSEDPRYSVESNGTFWNLVIKDVEVSDAGVYECQVSSKVRHLRHHVTLLVTEAKPEPNIEITGSDYVDEGDRIKLTCNATSKDYPLDDIDWFKAGSTLYTNHSRGMYIQKMVSLSTGTIFSTLEIEHARLSDQGFYVCRTSNKDVTNTYVNVLNGETSNVKRGTGPSEKVGAIHNDGDRNSNGCSAPSSPGIMALLVLPFLVSLLTPGHWHGLTDKLELT